jgi:hypothetical protein
MFSMTHEQSNGKFLLCSINHRREEAEFYTFLISASNVEVSAEFRYGTICFRISNSLLICWELFSHDEVCGVWRSDKSLAPAWNRNPIPQSFTLTPFAIPIELSHSTSSVARNFFFLGGGGGGFKKFS